MQLIKAARASSTAAFSDAKEDGGEEGLRRHSLDTGAVPGLNAWAEQRTFTQFVFVPQDNT